MLNDVSFQIFSLVSRPANQQTAGRYRSSTILALQFVVHWFSVAFAIFSGQKKEEEGW